MLERPQAKDKGAAAHSPLPIRRVDAIPVALPLKTPMKMSGITIATAENVLVRIEAADGRVGWGEAASAPTMTGDTLGGLVAAVRDHLAPLLVGKDAFNRPALMPALRRALIGNTGAHSAVEMALLDLTGSASKTRLVDAVAPKPLRTSVKPMWLLGNATPEEDIDEARAKAREGFHLLKLKIGVKPLADEIAAALAVREALGRKMPLCADANGGLTLANAKRYIERTRAARLAFVEQPLPHDDLAGLKALAKLRVPIGIDEGIHSLADVTANARAGAAGVSLKLIKLGGFTTAYEAAKLCRRLRLKINVAAKIAESSIATAAAVHLACVVPNVDWGVSLTHFYLAEDLVRQPLAIRDGAVALPQGPGLGIEVDEAAVERFRVR
jgi:L-alanine-DL-glutamate epimerase-like enolase superfamily enzyme